MGKMKTQEGAGKVLQESSNDTGAKSSRAMSRSMLQQYAESLPDVPI
jgi:hypothetical protein